MAPSDSTKTPVVMPKRRHRGLHTLEDVKRNISRACRKLEAGSIETERGRAWVYALRTLSQLMQEIDVERRLAAMEEELARLRMAKMQPATPTPKALIPA